VNVIKRKNDELPLSGWNAISLNLTTEKPITGGEIYNYQVLRSLITNGAKFKALNFPIPRGASLMNWRCFVLPWIWLPNLLSLYNKSIIITDNCFAPLFFLQFLILRVFSSTKLIILNHHSNAITRRNPFARFAFHISERLLLRCGHIIFLNSKRTYDEMNMKKVDWKVYHVAPAINAVPRFIDRRKRKRKCAKLLFVGYIVKRKGVHLLIESLGSCRELDWQLNIAGDESYSQDYARFCRRKVRDLGLGARINLLGFLTDEQLQKVYADADIFILPSEQEGYGAVYLEAASYALPIITTEVGLVGDILMPGEDVYVIPANDVDALTDAIRELITNRAKRISIGESAFSRINYSYGIEDMFQRANEVILNAFIRTGK
jgi:glycosyltransferase involved in cell wall biosynthesis